MSERPRKRRFGVSVAAWLSLVLGAYAVIAVASVLGLFTGGFAGVLGALIAVATLTDRPERRTRRLAKVALVLNGLAVAVCAAVLVWIGLSEL